jgi:beta-phosphoglucomutase-like phosphatase (HAD superfamily)
VVTGDTVAQGKPHPEAYLKAVELLRETDPSLSLEHCVALEDSTPGVAAAVASGVATVAIPHIVPLPEDERYVLWDSLAGRSRADLEELLRARTLPNGTAGYEHNPHEAATLEGAGAPGTAHD